MANAFNMLRPNDLIWPYVVNVYMKGHRPSRSTSSTGTRIRRACRRPTTPSICATATSRTSSPKGEMEIGGVKLDLKKVKIPIFNLAAREDHIAPARSVFAGLEGLRRPGGLCARRIGPYRRRCQPGRASRNTSSGPGGPVEGELEDWLARATEHPGHLVALLVRLDRAASPEAGAAREPASRKLSPSAMRQAPMWRPRVRAFSGQVDPADRLKTRGAHKEERRSFASEIGSDEHRTLNRHLAF